MPDLVKFLTEMIAVAVAVRPTTEVGHEFAQEMCGHLSDDLARARVPFLAMWHGMNWNWLDDDGGCQQS